MGPVVTDQIQLCRGRVVVVHQAPSSRWVTKILWGCRRGCDLGVQASLLVVPGRAVWGARQEQAALGMVLDGSAA